MTLNHEKLAGIATQPTHCEMTTQPVSGGFYASLEMKDDSIGNSIKTSWLFRHPAEVAEFLAALESAVAVARREFPAVVDQVTKAPAADIGDCAESLVPPNPSETWPHVDDPYMDLDEFDMPAAVQIESGPDSVGYFATVFIYDRVGAFSNRSLSIETKDELLGFFDSIRDSVAQAEQHVERADHRLQRAGDSGTTELLPGQHDAGATP